MTNATSQTPGKIRTSNSKIIRKRNNKNRTKINEIETKKLYKESTKQKTGSLKK
jgi:hypothetical protein